MRYIAALLILALSACSSKSDQAKHELEMVKAAHGSAWDICHAERKIAEAYLSEGADREYPSAKLTADLACQGAELDDRNLR